MDRRRDLLPTLLIVSFLVVVAVLRYPPAQTLPGDPLGLLVSDGTCPVRAPAFPGAMPSHWALSLAAVRLRMLEPVWPLLAGRSVLLVGGLLLVLCLLPSLLVRRPEGRNGMLPVLAAVVAWAAALVLQPIVLPLVVALAAAAPRGARRRLTAAAVAGTLLAVALAVAGGRTVAGDPGSGAVPGPACRRVVAAWWVETEPWGGLVRLGGAPRAAAVLGELTGRRPRADDLRLACAEASLAAGNDDAAAVHLDILRRSRPDDPSVRLAEAWSLLLTGQAGSALRRFRALAQEAVVPALAGEFCALRALGRSGEASAVRDRLEDALAGEAGGHKVLEQLPPPEKSQSSPR